MKRKLLLLAIIMLAGGLAIFTLTRSSKTENQNGSSTQSNQPTGPSQQQDDSDQFLVIKEWGVKFKLPKELQGDIAYGVSKIKQPEDGDDPSIIYVESKKLTAMSGLCGLSQNEDDYSSGMFGGRFSVSRTKVNADEYGNESSVTDGTYWYFAQPSHSSCDASGSTNSEVDKKDGEFKKAIVEGGVFNKVYKY